jgi:AraC-binding-like domain
MGSIAAAPKSLPLARHLLVQTSDLDEARERVARVFCEHKLAYLRPRHNLNMRQHVVRFGNLALSYITYGCDVSVDPGKLSTFFLVHFIPKGRCQIKIGRENLVGSATVGSVTSPISCSRSIDPRWSVTCRTFWAKSRRARSSSSRSWMSNPG